MGTLIGIILAGLAIYFLAATIYNYRRSKEEKLRERLIESAKGSLTLLISRASLVLAALVANAGDMVDALGAPQLSEYMNAIIGNPKTTGVVIAVMMLLIMVARKRTL